MILGTTYSHPHIKYIGLDSKKAFAYLLNLKFDILRLGCYWNEIENKKGVFNFTEIKYLLDRCEEENQTILLTIGMKAPRYPEFFIPKWVREKDINLISEEVLNFIKITVEELKNYKSIKYWQIENEPLDPSGPGNLKIPLEFLKKEVKLVRSLDKSRKILINLWGNDVKKRKTFTPIEHLADIVGLDLYCKVPHILNFYRGPSSSEKYYKNLIARSSKPVWITELQAEVWEKKESKRFDRKDPPSISPELMLQNYQKALSLDPKAIIFWGFEYWYLRHTKGDDRYLKSIKEIIRLNI